MSKKKTPTTIKQKFAFFCKCIGVCAILAIIGSAVWAFHTGLVSKKYADFKISFHNFIGQIGFQLNEGIIDGHKYTTLTEIDKAINVPQGTPITLLDLEAIHNRLIKLPWIKEVVVHTKLPNTLYVKITEKNPIARWQKDKKIYPLDEEGKIIPVKDENLDFLPIVIGEDAQTETPHLMQIIKQHSFVFDRLLSATRIGNRRWNIQIINEAEQTVSIYLPEDDLKTAFNRLDKMQKEHQIFNRKISQIDLRLPDKVIIQTALKTPIIHKREQPISQTLEADE